MENYDTAGNKIIPPFFYPCPQRCGLTGGCESCRTYKNAKPLIMDFEDNGGLTKEEGKHFYDKVFGR